MGLNVNFEGVYRGPNRHSQVPPGAAERAENIVSYNKGEAECVPGMENLSGTYTTGSERFSSGIPYDDYTIERTSTGALYRRAENGTLTAITTGISPPSGVSRVPYTEAGQDLYMATSSGILAMDGGSDTPAIVEVPKAWAPYSVTANTGGSILADGESVAYRTTISKQTAEGIWREGAPSGRVVGTNNEGMPAGMNVYTHVPSNAEVGDRLRIYRTTIATGDPGDIMFLAHEHDIEASDISTDSGYQYNMDDTPDALLGAPLYTNGTQGGIQRQNERPPLADVIVGFDDYLLACNVQGPQRIVIRLLAPLAVNDTVTINGIVYTAKDPAVSLTDGDFDNGDSLGLTVSEQIAYQMISLARTIRIRTGNSTIRAEYLSSPTDAPGILGLEAILLTTGTFTVSSSVGGSFAPNLTSAQSSLATTERSGIWVSKRGEHWAFPPLRSSSATYRFRVGTKDRDILAAVALREAVIVFTNGDGVFKVQRVGTELWRADQINSTLQLLVPGSVAVVDNQVIALTNKGIVAVDTSGVEEIDLPIKKAVDSILALSSSTITSYTFGVGDEARNRYILYHPESNSDTTSTHAWVYNGTTGTWTERTDDASGGFVDPDTGLLYLGSSTAATLTRERTGTDAQVYKRPDNTAIPFRLEWTVMDEGDPGASKQFAELRLLTEEAFSGNVTFNCTNDLGGTESTTAVATSEPFARAWVPDGCQWTSRLKVDIQRSVLSEAFTVVGMKTLLAGMEDGSFTR
jgi:hypothetical protein